MVSLSAWNLARAHLSIRIQVPDYTRTISSTTTNLARLQCTRSSCLGRSRDSLLLLLQSHVMTS